MRKISYWSILRELKCDSERCAPVTVLHLGYLQFDRYFVDVSITLVGLGKLLRYRTALLI